MYHHYPDRQSTPAVDRCTHTKPSGARCKLRTSVIGPYCWIHCKQEGLQVKNSTIPGGGKELFAVKSKKSDPPVIFKKKQKIDTYAGEVVSPTTSGPYVHRVNSKKSIDAFKTNSCAARYANAPRGTDKHANAHLGARGDKGTLVAEKSIQDGQEILTNYGRGYWQAHK